MISQHNIAIAQQFLEGIGTGRDPAKIAELFADDLIFEVQGDDGVLPWIGRSSGRQALAHFIRDARMLVEPINFHVEDILASDTRAAIVGDFQSRSKATGKVISSQFVIVLTIAGDLVTRFQMLEDSFAVAKAVRH
jgi:ketosteroid isomerase-like protein